MTALCYVTVVICWSFTWYAIKMQFGVVAPEVSVLWRFAVAAVLMWAGLAACGRLRRVPIRRHAWFALMGLCLFSVNFILVYEAERHIASGVVSVVFTLSTAFNIVNARLFLKTRARPRILVGVGLGVLGVALMFARTLTGLEGGAETLIGVAAALAGTLVFSFGNIATPRARGLDVDAPNAIARAMTWGVLFIALNVWRTGAPITFDLSARYLSSLGFLSVFGTNVAFIAYTQLLARIGPARAAYASVLFPVIALTVSTVLEGYDWTLPAMIGAPLTLLGNIVIFTGARRPPTPARD